MALKFLFYSCPYCGEEIDKMVDLSEGDQEYIEDCHSCAKPTRFVVYVQGDDDFMLDVYAMND
ncbi:CPXCG motif-containing cysteine-rich protein [Kitasatospora sp. NPDC047058]|uniref:CPXCG motif-containing cysteine-rich protein n=1 Tax=Kitasatospora sp. NPDC047058 TaxID=3155620 RepID=UPI003406C3DC